VAPVQSQNYASHRSVDYRIYFCGLLVLASLILTGVSLTLGSMYYALVGQLLLAVGVLGGWLQMRKYAVTVQDRIIRLEMQLRLARVLSAELNERAKGLGLSQLIGLRFAGDTELPELVEKILQENITRADDIKKLVKDWQADFLRV